MANTIITKNSSTASAVPTSGDLVQGELAVNVTDKRLFTEDSGGTVVELGTNPSQLNFADNAKAIFGAGSDLQIYHSGSDSLIRDEGTGNFIISTNGTAINIMGVSNSEYMAQFVQNEDVRLYYNNSQKFATTSTGIDVTGDVVADGLTVDGVVSISSTNSRLRLFETDTTDLNTQFQNSSGDFNISTLADDAASSTVRLKLDHATGDIFFYENTGTTPKFFWDASAESLGIGTSSPSSSVYVSYDSGTTNDYTNAGQGLTIQNTSTTKPASLKLVNAAVGQQIVWGGSNGDSYLAFKNYSAERMRIDSAGNVGIGTVTPTDTLDVAGGITISAADGLDVTGSDSTASQTPLVFYRGGVGDKTGTACRIRTVGDGANNAVTMIFDTADTERMRIDSAGNVGINTAAPATMLELSASNNALAGSPPNNILRFNDTDTTVAADQPTGRIEFYVNDAGAGGTGVGSYIEGRAAGTSGGGYLAFAASGSTATGAAEQMRITQAGNVGIGTSSPAQKLHIDGNLLFENNNEIRFKDSGATQRTAIAMSSNDLNIGTSAGGNLKFYNGSSYTERARIDSSGNLLVGTTSSFGSGVGFCGFANGNAALRLKRGADYGATARFYNFGGSEVGSITVNASSTSYVTSSDYRLKEDWVAVADASTRVNALKPVNFAWKVDGSRVDGFLAHELAEVVPEAVTGEKDAVDADGNPKYQGIDQSKLVPLLTAALQEALVKIESLTARVSALEGN